MTKKHKKQRLTLLLLLFQGVAFVSFAQCQPTYLGNPDSLRRIFLADEDTAMRARYLAFVKGTRM
jgi:hypothetical protein